MYAVMSGDTQVYDLCSKDGHHGGSGLGAEADVWCCDTDGCNGAGRTSIGLGISAVALALLVGETIV